MLALETDRGLNPKLGRQPLEGYNSPRSVLTLSTISQKKKGPKKKIATTIICSQQIVIFKSKGEGLHAI
jgi:hypothetical protein